MGQKYVYNSQTCEYEIIDEGAPGARGPRGPIGNTGPAGPPGPPGPPGGESGIQDVLAFGNVVENGQYIEFQDTTNNRSMSVGPSSVRTTNNSSGSTSLLAPDFLSIGSDGGGPGASLNPESLSVGDGAMNAVGARLVATGSLDGPFLELSNEQGAFGAITLLNSATQSSMLYMPETAGAEYIATREWVTNNFSGGGGGVPYIAHLEEVLTAGDVATNRQITLQDNTGQQWVNIQSNIVQVRNSGGDVTINPNSIGFNAMATFSVSPDPMAAMGGTFLLPDSWSGGADTIATREWVAANYSGGGGGGGGDLQSVLAAGNSATGSNREIQLAPGYIQLMGDSGMGEMNPSLTAQSGLLLSAMSGGQVQLTNNQLTMEDMMSGGQVALTGTGMTITPMGNSPVQIQADPMAAMGGTFLFPDAYSGGADTIATREWVAANYSGGGGGGAVPTLEQVLMSGSAAVSQSIMLQDSMYDFSLSLNPNFLSVSSMMGTTGQLTPTNLTLGDSGGNGQIQLAADNMMGPIEISLNDSNGLSRIMREATSGNGTLILPDTSYSPQIIATRDYVRQYGDSTSRPATPEIAEQYFDTTLGKPIWYNGSGWVDATGTVV